MSIATVASSISAKIVSEWPALEPTVPLTYPNSLHDPTTNEYLIVDIIWAGGEAITIGAPGNNRNRRDGYIWLHAFIETGKGQNRAWEIASKAASIFEQQDFAGVVCQAMEPGAGESGTDSGRWYGQSVAVPFWFDEDV